MIKSIIYWSNYGSTRRYAELLSKDMGIPASPLHNAGASDGEAFYLGCVMDGRIKGYGRVAGRFKGEKKAPFVQHCPAQYPYRYQLPFFILIEHVNCTKLNL